MTGQDRYANEKTAKQKFAEKNEKRRSRPVPLKQATCESYIDGYDAKVYRFMCPSNCKPVRYRPTVGTDEYSNRTPVCMAAVHAGILKYGRGGEVTIQVNRGRLREFKGSTRHGITSKSDRTNGVSFTFVK